MDASDTNVKPWFRDSRLIAGAFLFVSVSLLWIYCLPPGLAAYRDAGEMACDVYTLGIAHQPGYPLYILAAKLASLVLPGNFAYRLNLFSAACGAAALLALYVPLSARFGVLPALASALLFSLNFTVQTVSGVSEMYSLNLFIAALVLLTALSFESSWSARRFWLGAYLIGLGMTNRMDIVLMSPAFAIAVWPRLRTLSAASAVRTVSLGALFWLAGFSLYLYLYVRSGADPLFDWSHPADLSAFLAVITRKSYGSTLDLISRHYAPGELFLPNLKHYALHLARNFNFALAAAAVGALAEFSGARRRFFLVLAVFAVPGPVFLYMANMPPNPHALAIVEPYYLLPDMAVVFWAAAGLAFLGRRSWAPLAVLAAASICVAMAAWKNLPQSCRRTSFAAEDWGRDALGSVPPSAVLVGKKDVQLFTLWYLQTVRGVRPDIRLVSQGLSGAAWYRNSKKIWQPGLKLFDLNSGGAAEWKRFIGAYPGGAFATLDADLPSGIETYPRGLVNAFTEDGAADMWNSYNFRWFGGRNYRDFFEKDLGASYAAAAVGRAVWKNGHGGIGAEDAERLKLAFEMDPDLPEAPLYLGFYYSSKGDWAEAARSFRLSAEANGRLVGLAGEYRSLPELKASITRSGAYAWLNYGVALERTGDRQGAETAYARALSADPGMADAHYNTAILYWGRDPRRVYQELRAALKIDPGHERAAYYLNRISGSRKK